VRLTLVVFVLGKYASNTGCVYVRQMCI